MDAWLEQGGRERGAVVGLEQMWALAHAWYDGRMDPAWRGRSSDEARAILETVGLSGPFWELG